jgi:exodeoxyribonuclease VII large subunit
LSLYFRVTGDQLIFFGPGTFHKKDQLKAQGARFNGISKSWVMPLSDEGLALAKSLGAVGTAQLDTQDQAPSQIASSTSEKSRPKNDLDALRKALGDGLKVSELMQQAAASIAREFPNPVWIIGEIQSLNQRGDHVYLELAEGKADAHQTSTVTVKASIWASSRSYLERKHGAQCLKDILQPGSAIRCLARVQLYKDRGQISLTIEDIDPKFSQGLMALQRMELLKKLRAQGLVEANKRLRIPAFPFRIGLITAPESRAYSDFTHQLTDTVGTWGRFSGTIIFAASAMQGDHVPKDVTRSLHDLARENVDLIVITRGGGSQADLRWFDGEEIALAIAKSPVPVICAIGHHDDQSVAEEICHTREKTPTAAADFVLEIFRRSALMLDDHALTFERHVEQLFQLHVNTLQILQSRLSDGSQTALTRLTDRLALTLSQLERIALRSIEDSLGLLQRLGHGLSLSSHTRLVHAEGATETIAQSLDRDCERALVASEKQIMDLLSQLDRINPKPWLEKGWTQLFEQKNLMDSVHKIKDNQSLTARLIDGLVDLKVTAVKPIKPKSP